METSSQGVPRAECSRQADAAVMERPRGNVSDVEMHGAHAAWPVKVQRIRGWLRRRAWQSGPVGFDIEAWSDYAVAMVGAAAALTGLLSVAVSINSAWFSSSEAHRGFRRS